MYVMVLYDISSTPVRTRIASVCKDFGLHRVQCSVFLGRLGTELRDELCERLYRTLGPATGTIHIVPLFTDSVRAMQILQNEHPDTGKVPCA